jgi:hypothetical protein
MQSQAISVEDYLASMPTERREAVSAVRSAILKNLPSGYQEGMQYGMIGYFVPHTLYPAGYHCDPAEPLPFVGLANQKNHMALYMFCLYLDAPEAEKFRESWLATGHKLDMGKSCIRFKRLADVPLDVVGKAVRIPVKRFVAHYEQIRQGGAVAVSKKAVAKKAAPQKTASTKLAQSAKPTKKKAVSKKTPTRKAGTRPSRKD